MFILILISTSVDAHAGDQRVLVENHALMVIKENSLWTNYIFVLKRQLVITR